MRGKNNMPLIGAINAAGDATLGLLKVDTSDRLILGAGVTTTLMGQGARNYFSFLGGAGVGLPVQISPQGLDADINAEYLSKGNGVVWLGNEHGFSFQVQSPASPAGTANRVFVRGTASGSSAATLGTVGTDIDVDLTIALQGAGKLRFGTFSAAAGETFAGTITIRDSGGTLRKVAIFN